MASFVINYNLSGSVLVELPELEKEMSNYPQSALFNLKDEPFVQEQVKHKLNAFSESQLLNNLNFIIPTIDSVEYASNETRQRLYWVNK